MYLLNITLVESQFEVYILTYGEMVWGNDNLGIRRNCMGMSLVMKCDTEWGKSETDVVHNYWQINGSTHCSVWCVLKTVIEEQRALGRAEQPLPIWWLKLPLSCHAEHNSLRTMIHVCRYTGIHIVYRSMEIMADEMGNGTQNIQTELKFTVLITASQPHLNLLVVSSTSVSQPMEINTNCTHCRLCTSQRGIGCLRPFRIEKQYHTTNYVVTRCKQPKISCLWFQFRVISWHNNVPFLHHTLHALLLEQSHYVGGDRGIGLLLLC